MYSEMVEKILSVIDRILLDIDKLLQILKLTIDVAVQYPQSLFKIFNNFQE